MSRKRPTKRSSHTLTGQNATLDQYFSIKKMKPNENVENISTNENDLANYDKTKKKDNVFTLTAKNDSKSKQHQLSIPFSEHKKQPLQDRTIIPQKRQPLAVISDSPHCLNLPPVDKPRQPAFLVLRDEEIDQGATEVDQQEQKSNLPTPLPVNNATQPTQEESPTQSVPVVDTQSSILTSLSSPVAIVSQDSFFGDEDFGIEFRVDSIENDDTDEEKTDDDNDDDTASFFMDEHHSNNIHLPTLSGDNEDEQHNSNSPPPTLSGDNEEEDEQNPLYLTKTYRRSHRRPTAAAASSTRQDLSSDTEESPINKQEEDGTLPEEETPTLEFTVYDSLTIPLDIKTNYVSDDDEEATEPSQQISDLSSSTTSSSSPGRSIDQPTLPMSSPFDESSEIHVAYPIPRGKNITDKFGATST